MAFITVAIIGGSVALAGGAAKLGMSLSGRKKRIAEQKAAKQQMEDRMEDYENLDTSNLYADARNQYANIQTNFENVFEDLTVNQKQAQFQAQQGAQARADILGGLRGAAGGAGVGALAQSLANQQARQQQAISASIGQQEAANRRARAEGAANIQRLEGLGEAQRQENEMARTQTIFGMDMQRVTAANEALAAERQRRQQGMGQLLGYGIMGLSQGAFGDFKK